MDRFQRNLLAGVVIGALLGAAVAYYVEQMAEEDQDLELTQNPMDWLRFGIAALGIGRQFAELLVPEGSQEA